MSTERKQIAIVEIYSHHVFVHTLSLCLLTLGHHVTVYVSRRIYRDLEPMFFDNDVKPSFVVSEEQESDLMFLYRTKAEIDEFDLLFLNSIQGYRVGFFYLFKYKPVTIAGAGRISEFFGSRYKLLGFGTIRQVLHHNYTRFFLPKIIARLRGIIVHSSRAGDRAVDSGYLGLIHCMPFSLHIPRHLDSHRRGKDVHFLITGQMTARSRDYIGVLKMFESIWESGCRNATLTVLSSPTNSPVKDYAYRVYDEMVRLGSLGYPITYFSDWIPEEKFVYHSSKADFLVAPILQHYYGAGEITSVEVESARMGLPAFYPEWYFTDASVKERSFKYGSFDHLQCMIVDICKDPSVVKSIRQKALNNAQAFEVGPVSNELDVLLARLFDKETSYGAYERARINE